jgi:hypothetical protein
MWIRDWLNEEIGERLCRESERNGGDRIDQEYGRDVVMRPDITESPWSGYLMRRGGVELWRAD